MKSFIDIVNEAHTAGLSAVKAKEESIHPMIVEDRMSGQSWYVADGVCGFAWIAFPGNTAFGRWAKKSGLARSHYPKGLSIWVHEFNQSMQKKEIYARAFAEVLRSNGISAYAGSRMD